MYRPLFRWGTLFNLLKWGARSHFLPWWCFCGAHLHDSDHAMSRGGSERTRAEHERSMIKVESTTILSKWGWFLHGGGMMTTINDIPKNDQNVFWSPKLYYEAKWFLKSVKRFSLAWINGLIVCRDVSCPMMISKEPRSRSPFCREWEREWFGITILVHT